MSKPQPRTTISHRTETATELAERLCQGFKAHDDRNREAAIEAFAAVDHRQFAHLDREAAEQAAIAYVDALWEKDTVEGTAAEDGIDRDEVAAADWSPVREAFRRRARVAGIDERYARLSTRAWIKHKTGGDYWTPIRAAQMYELRAALQDPDYPHKPRYGQSGHGPEPARYALAVELHDMATDRHWRQAVDVMEPYFERILRERTD
ncbi:MAG: hypothetical protein ABEH64_03090 [Salinirussus sp.]